MKLLQHRSHGDAHQAPLMIGDSPALQRLLAIASRIAAGQARVFLNFLAAHDCAVDYREFRPGIQHQLPPVVAPAASDARAVVAG